MYPSGGCNLAAGLLQAYNQLTGSNSRSGAMKAIVVVTDSVPTVDLEGNSYPDPTANARALNQAVAIAAQCSDQGIPIFMVTLDQQSGAMTPYLQAQYSDTATGGVVYTAGHGGTLYINNWSNVNNSAASLNGSFNNVLRQLTALVKG